MLFKIFPALDTFWNITLFVIFIILALYLLILIINLVFIFSFKRMLRRDSKAVRVSLSGKLDSLRKLQELLLAKEIKLSEQTTHSLRYLDPEDFVHVDSDDCNKAREELTYIEAEVKRVLADKNELQKETEIAILISLINETNNSLKFAIMSYNADVLGYNYWVRFAPYIYLYLMFRVKLKKTI